MSVANLAVLGLIIALAPMSAIAEIPTASVPQEALRPFMVARDPAALAASASSANVAAARSERAAAINGSTYAIVSPTFTGADGNVSFFRFYNSGSSWDATPAPSVTFPLTVVGSPSGTVYGTTTITVPPAASPQYSLSEILTVAGAGALSGNDTSYTIYVAPTDAHVASQGYEHVIYNNSNGFFEDASACKAYEWKQNATQKLLVNVHSSALPSYPSQVLIHNYQNTAVSYAVSITDARTGTLIGRVSLNTEANATYVIQESFFETQLNWTPGSNQQHLNFFFQNAASASSAVNAVVGQFIFNQRLSAYINMSVTCKVTAG